jgi:hypothetical protein
MFAGWDSFYLMLGGAAASLVGLLFVVVTLTHSRDREQAERGASIYLTPTVVHFSMVLTAAATAVAPRLPPAASLAVIGLAALAGVANSLRAAVRMHLWGKGPPHWSDFWLYGFAPAALYLTVGGADVALAMCKPWAADVLAAALLALLLLGIRNAWDLVTWISPRRDGMEPS